MRFLTVLAVAAAFAAPASAQSASALVAKPGQTLRDVKATRLGVIDRVNADGSLRLIVGSRIVTVPAETVAVTDAGVTTSLSKRDVAKLR